MISKGDKTWASGAWLSIEGIYGNTVFKNYMSITNSETFKFSLHYPIIKYEQWRMNHGSVPNDWTSVSFIDSSWNQITPGNITMKVPGVQYYRKAFNSLDGMAAYEVSFKYRYGIVAYLNGVEIYRDNMPEGVVTSSTLASASYPSVDFHSIIRSGYEVYARNFMLAVELHFRDTEEYSVTFDSFLSLLAPSIQDNECFVYPYEMILSSPSISNATNLFDFAYDTSFVNTEATDVSYSLAGAKALINSIRIYPHTNPAAAPHSFIFSGTNDKTNPTWRPIIQVKEAVYDAKSYKIFSGYLIDRPFTEYQFSFLSNATTFEAQPLICYQGIPSSIPYDRMTYPFLIRYEPVLVKPTSSEFTNCTITPTPAAGLSFDSTTCALTGFIPKTGITKYTVWSVMYGKNYTGSFELQGKGCDGIFLRIRRVYKENAKNEGYTVQSSSSILDSVSLNSGQQDNTEVSKIVCLTTTVYKISVSSSAAAWADGSFLYIEYLIGNTPFILKRARFDNILGLPLTASYSIESSILENEEWEYKMGVVPENWYNSSISWEDKATAGHFPASTNQIQLYKKNFVVSRKLSDYAAAVITLNYQYGVLIYLNGHEVFRKGINSALTNSTMASTSLEQLGFHQISIPIKTFGSEGSPSKEYLVSGDNHIAIALIATNAQQTASTFECVIHLIDSSAQQGEVMISSSNIQGTTTSVLNDYSGSYITSNACTNNYLQFDYPNDNHIWLSSFTLQLFPDQSNKQPRKLVVKGKNAEDTDWKTLKTVETMSWSLQGQRKHLWLLNNYSYNQYRIENISTGDSSACEWKLGSIGLWTEITHKDPPAFNYATPITLYADIEMGEVYPNSQLFHSFTVSPSFPSGISIDPNTGIISGTTHTAVAASNYTISALKMSGEAVSKEITLDVITCTGGKSLITLVVRTDSTPSIARYSLHKGKSPIGDTIVDVDGLLLANTLNYGDFCLPDGLYTLQLTGGLSGWENPAGYYLTIDVGEMKFEMGYVYRDPSPAVVDKTFSSYLPFQINYSEWKVYKSTVPANWNTIDYDDSTWTKTKASLIGVSESITVYLRQDLNIPTIDDYHVLNVRMRYAGGVVVYVNGYKVARFNLEEEFTENSMSIAVHDPTIFSKFHVVLSTVAAVTGKNVIAFEIHRPLGQTSSSSIQFDATGIFGVNDCSIGVDSFVDISGSTGYIIGSLANFFDLTTITYGYQDNLVGTFLQWSVENLEGTMFNSYAIEAIDSRSKWGMSLTGTLLEQQTPISVFNGTNLNIARMSRNDFSTPLGLAGFRSFRQEVTAPASGTIYFSSLLFQYCSLKGEDICPSVNEYPPAKEGEVSASKCAYGYIGYSYRECHHNVLGEIKTDHCVYRLPELLTYDEESYVFVKDIATSVSKPTYRYLITLFAVDGGMTLPTGLTLDSTTGVIAGTPTVVTNDQTYTIVGSNPSGSTSANITMRVRLGECQGDGRFPLTQVDQTAVYDCHTGGEFVGILTRTCKLGEKDGEWQEIHGECIPYSEYCPSNFAYTPNRYVIPVGTSVMTPRTIKGMNLTYSLEAGTIPAGLHLDSVNGYITGTATEYTPKRELLVKVANDISSAQASISFTILTTPANLYYSDTTFILKKRVQWTVTPTVIGDELSFSITNGTLPTGLTFNEKTGEISGIPTRHVVNIMIEVTATNQVGSTQTYVSFTVELFSLFEKILLISVSVIVVAALLVVIFILSNKVKRMTIIKRYRIHKKESKRLLSKDEV